jgi:hypothetical protein
MGLQSRLTGQRATPGAPPPSPFELLARQARTVLEARMVNVSRFDPLAQRLTSFAWAWSSESAYERALAAAQRVIPGFDPSRHPIPARVNPAIQACVGRAERVVVPFEQITAGTVHPWVVRLARVVMGLEWTISVPLLHAGAVAGTFAAHFSQRPSDAQVQVAQSYADEFGRLMAVSAGPPGAAPH